MSKLLADLATTTLEEWFITNEILTKKYFDNTAYRHQRYFFDTVLRSLFYGETVYAPSTHTSVNIKLPVYLFMIDGMSVLVRDNFHNFACSVQTTHPLYLTDTGFITTQQKYLFWGYFEGFTEGTIYNTYTTGCTEFSFLISSEYDLYAQLYNIKQYVTQATQEG